MRVLLPLHGFIGWNGGLDLVRLIKSALTHPDIVGDIDLYFAWPESSDSRRLLVAAVRRWRGFRAKSQHTAEGNDNALRKIARDITEGCSVVTCRASAAGILEAAAAVNADIIFPTMSPLGRSPQRRIGYLFDFQHHHLPHLFSRRIRQNRDQQFAKIAADADGIMVNSRMVARDVTQFLGVSPERILAMPFTPYAQPWWLDVDAVDVQQRYAINGPYLLICNHFWLHKDHATAFRAFAQLKESSMYADLQLVLTGDPIDFRDPQHYGRLKSLTKNLGIANNTHFLGLIAKGDQLALMRGCSALVQPTLFEGGPGGGSVYEAIGLGVPTVVSDIEINREIPAGEVSFFRAGHAYDLAVKLDSVLSARYFPWSREELLLRSDKKLLELGTAIVDFLATASLTSRA